MDRESSNAIEQNIKMGEKVFIRNAGKDEYWLQDIIYANPEKLRLGNLVVLRKERQQSKGGRLDLLLKDQSNDTMYEIEVMLGETDPSHIIRTIEYWDNEKRKYPLRKHYAVLIAEKFDRRYFNVIQLLSLSVPMIAIQADLIDIGTQKILNFTKILDIYVEQEEEEETKQVTEATWNDRSAWTLETAKKHLEILSEIEKNIDLKYTQSYISLVINGKNYYMYDKRTKPNSCLWFNIKDDEKVETINRLFDDNNIVYSYNSYKDFSLTIDKQFLIKNQALVKSVHETSKKELTNTNDE